MPGEALLPLAVLAILAWWWLWVGRDPRPGTIVPTWRPPEGIRPGPAGALVDQRADAGDVLATILDLARRGWFTIVESHPSGVPARGTEDAAIARALLEATGAWETEWRFVRTEKSAAGLDPYEGAVLVAIFGDAKEASARALKATFPAHVPGIRAALYNDLLRKGLFLHSPDRSRREWVALAAAVAVAGVLAGVWLDRWPLALALLASAGIVALFARWMPVPTRRGAAMRDRLLGLREYIRRAEASELEFRHAPQKSPALFDEILPWAIALDVSDLWLAEFRALLPDTPPWYAREGASEPTSFTLELGVFLGATLRTIASAP